MKLEFHVSLFIFHEKNICIERVCTKNRIVGRKKKFLQLISLMHQGGIHNIPPHLEIMITFISLYIFD